MSAVLGESSAATPAGGPPPAVVTSPPRSAEALPADVAPRGHWPPPRKRITTAIQIAAVAVLALLAVMRAWEVGPFRTAIQVTDNAYIRGRTTIVAPQVSGYVVQVLVSDYVDVAAGQMLARIDDRTYRAQFDQAKAALDVQLAALANLGQTRVSRLASLRG